MQQLRIALITTLALFFLAGAALAGGKEDLIAAARTKNPQEGIRLATRAIASGELTVRQKAMAYSNRSRDYLALKKYAQAVADCNQALKILPKYPEALQGRAMAYRNMGQYQKALDDLAAAISLRPKYPRAYYTQATTYERMGKLDLAIASAQKAVELSGGHPATKRLLQRLQQKRGAK